MYFGLIYEDIKNIRNVTSCLKPCNYLEEEFHGEPMPSTFVSSGDSIFSNPVHHNLSSSMVADALDFYWGLSGTEPVG